MCLEVAVGRLSAGGWACIPPCWLFGQRGPNTGSCRLLGGIKSWHQNGSLQESLRRRLFTEASTISVLAPSESYSRPPPSQETHQDTQVGLVQAPTESLTCPESQHLWHLMCTRQQWSHRFSQVLRSSPAGLQSQMLWGLLLSVPDPQAGKPDVGFRTLTPGGETLWQNYLPVCGRQWIWNLIIYPKLPSYHLVVLSSWSSDV